MTKKLRIAFLDFGERWSRSIKVGIVQNGHEAYEIQAYKLQSFEELLDTLDSIQPDFCLSRNFYLINHEHSNSGTYKDFFLNQKHRFVVWYHDSVEFNDPPYLLDLWQSPPYPQNTLFFSIESEDRSFFAQRGLPFIHLPIGAGDHFFHLHKHPQFLTYKENLKCDLSFVGTQIIELEAPPQSKEELATGLGEGYALSLAESLSEGDREPFLKLIVTFFESDFRSPKEFKSALSQLVIDTSKKISPSAAKMISMDRGRLNSFYSWMKLTNLLTDLQKFDIHIFGSELWNTSIRSYSHQARGLGEEELTACYAASKINLNFSKYHFSSGVHERPFNILAAQGFPLTDYREDLQDLFHENEISTYGSDEELDEKISFFLKNESLRLDFIRRGHARVKKDHTYQKRLETLIDQATEYFGL